MAESKKGTAKNKAVKPEETDTKKYEAEAEDKLAPVKDSDVPFDEPVFGPDEDAPGEETKHTPKSEEIASPEKVADHEGEGAAVTEDEKAGDPNLGPDYSEPQLRQIRIWENEKAKEAEAEKRKTELKRDLGYELNEGEKKRLED